MGFYFLTYKKAPVLKPALFKITNITIFTLCTCMALGYLEEYLEPSKRLGR
jgi:hypothetical protein